jgi:hypothetical protein
VILIVRAGTGSRQSSRVPIQIVVRIGGPIGIAGLVVEVAAPKPRRTPAVAISIAAVAWVANMMRSAGGVKPNGQVICSGYPSAAKVMSGALPTPPPRVPICAAPRPKPT